MVDLLKRAFGPGTVELDRIYVGDITYIWTWEDWAYLATVIDLSSRRVVGWVVADHMRTELVSDALGMAIDARRPAPGLVFHGDRGSQFRSRAFGPCSREPDSPVDGSGRAAGDNAAMESFFWLLQKNVFDRRRWRTRCELTYEVIVWIEHTYNRRRRQRALGKLTPVEFELAFSAPPCLKAA